MTATEMNWGTELFLDPVLIVIDHVYQREAKKELIAGIAAHFDPMYFGRPVCLRRENNPMYYCIDGQQRITAAREAGIRSVPVVAFEISKIAREAEVFVAINEMRKALTGFDKHKGKVVAGEPAAVQLERAVETAGFAISQGHSSRSIGAVGALGGAFEILGEDGIVQMLTVIKEAWPEDELALSAGFISALSTIIASHMSAGTYTRSKFVNSLKKTSPTAIKIKSENFRFTQGTTRKESLLRAFKVLAKV